MHALAEALSYKHILALIFALMCFTEIRRGFLKPFKGYLQSLSARPYLLLFAGAFTGALLLMPFDARLLLKIQSVQHPVLDPLIRAGAALGKANGAWGPLAALYFLALMMRSERLRNLFFGAVLTSALTGLLAHVFKFIFMRARPYNDLGPFHFFDIHGFIRDDRAFQSFPSGDVAIAAGAAAFLFLFFRRRSVSWIFLVVPFFTALSRIDLNKHWPSDTLFAFLVSFAAAKFTLDYFTYSWKQKS